MAAGHQIQGPRLATDCIVADEAGNLVLIRRRNEPFKGSYALPGGFVEAGETIEDACRREVKEETNLEIYDVRLLGVYSDPDRDPRGHVVSVAFRARAELARLKAGDDAAQVEVVGNWRDRSLAFDHRQMIEDSLKAPELCISQRS
jgi:8-oxo-dGTP diphosphatase